MKITAGNNNGKSEIRIASYIQKSAITILSYSTVHVVTHMRDCLGRNQH